MGRQIFDDVVRELPLLTADGFLSEDSPGFSAKRGHFLRDGLYRSQVERVQRVLGEIGKSERFSEWQRDNCRPDRLTSYFAWRLGEPVTEGSIIAAAVSLGFTMGVRDSQDVYFNFSADAIESGLAEFRTYEQAERVKLPN